MTGVRAALYLDFDNVFSGLLKLDPVAAVTFAESPGTWLTKLSTSQTVDGPRRWLVLRCYLNSGGSVRDADGEPIRFCDFRPHIAGAGFDVIDCPPFFQGAKNSADIKITVDVITALHGPVEYDEFVIASADSDFTPLLTALRAADRRTTLVSTFRTADAMKAVADRFVDGEQMLGWLPRSPSATAPGVDAGRASFQRIAIRQYRSATAPLPLSTLAQAVHQEVGPLVKATKWFGHGSFSDALQSLELPHMALSPHHVWDSTRHKRPSS